MPQVHIVVYCVDLGYGPARGAEMLSLMLGLGVVSRLISGLIADRIGGVGTLLLGSTLQFLALLFYLPFDGLMSLYIVSALFGGLAAIPFLLIFAVIRERNNVTDAAEPEIPFLETVRTAWKNIPFRFATGLYMLNWITFDLVALALPFFLAYWVSNGNLLQKALGLPLESAVFACLLVTSVIVLPFWVWLARRLGKQRAYIIGMSFWAVVQLLIYAIQPGQITFILVLAVLAGISVSTAHVLPDAIFPDVIEWDELRTGRRREGIYYGVKNFVRKLTGALAIFIALQTLGWFGYQSPPVGATQFTQPDSALGAIRFLIGPLGALLLFGAVAMAWFYPLTKERHTRIRSMLARKKERAMEKEGV